eukprot:4702610-Karenia_brevis.AAC.1
MLSLGGISALLLAKSPALLRSLCLSGPFYEKSGGHCAMPMICPMHRLAAFGKSRSDTHCFGFMHLFVVNVDLLSGESRWMVGLAEALFSNSSRMLAHMGME